MEELLYGNEVKEKLMEALRTAERKTRLKVTGIEFEDYGRSIKVKFIEEQQVHFLADWFTEFGRLIAKEEGL